MLWMAICPLCGWFKCRKTCDYCGEQMIRTETTVSDAMQMSDKEEQELIKYYCETLIKDTFNPNAKEYREANEKPISWYGIGDKPRCPHCKSTNISKISTLNRAVSISFWGLASSKIGKTHKCNNCGSTW